MAKDLFLFVDTKTNGLPISWVEPHTNVLNWPRIVQIAWIICDPLGKPLEEQAYTIQPQGYNIPTIASDYHGITTEYALENGTEPVSVLLRLADIIEKATDVVGHNMIMHENVIGAEMVRFDIQHKLFERHRTCTKIESTTFCNLAGSKGPRWPKLYELYEILFYTPLAEKIEILKEVEAVAKCFFELKKMNAIR